MPCYYRKIVTKNLVHEVVAIISVFIVVTLINFMFSGC